MARTGRVWPLPADLFILFSNISTGIEGPGVLGAVAEPPGLGRKALAALDTH